MTRCDISYRVRIEFHILIHVEIQTNASDWTPPESDVSKHVGDLTLAVTDTFLANLTRSNVWQCWQPLEFEAGNSSYYFQPMSSEFSCQSTNQSLTLYDTFPTGNTWGLVSWRWCIVIIFDNLNIMNTLFPARANTHKHLLSLCDQ